MPRAGYRRVNTQVTAECCVLIRAHCDCALATAINLHAAEPWEAPPCIHHTVGRLLAQHECVHSPPALLEPCQHGHTRERCQAGGIAFRLCRRAILLRHRWEQRPSERRLRPLLLSSLRPIRVPAPNLLRGTEDLRSGAQAQEVAGDSKARDDAFRKRRDH